MKYCGSFQALLDAHDRIAKELSTGVKDAELVSPWEEFGRIPTPIGTSKGPDKMPSYRTEVHEEPDSVVYAQPIRILSLRKSAGQPLVRNDYENYA